MEYVVKLTPTEDSTLITICPFVDNEKDIDKKSLGIAFIYEYIDVPVKLLQNYKPVMVADMGRKNQYLNRIASLLHQDTENGVFGEVIVRKENGKGFSEAELSPILSVMVCLLKASCEEDFQAYFQLCECTQMLKE